MTLLHERHDSDLEVELFIDDQTQELEIWVRSNEYGVFGIECGRDGKLAIQAFHHPFAYRDNEPAIPYDLARAIGAYSD